MKKLRLGEVKLLTQGSRVPKHWRQDSNPSLLSASKIEASDQCATLTVSVGQEGDGRAGQVPNAGLLETVEKG